MLHNERIRYFSIVIHIIPTALSFGRFDHKIKINVDRMHYIYVYFVRVITCTGVIYFYPVDVIRTRIFSMQKSRNDCPKNDLIVRQI